MWEPRHLDPSCEPNSRVRPTLGHALFPAAKTSSASPSSPGSTPGYLQRTPHPPEEKPKQLPGTATPCPWAHLHPPPQLRFLRVPRTPSRTSTLALGNRQMQSRVPAPAPRQVRAGPEDAPPPEGRGAGPPPPPLQSLGAPPSGRREGTGSAPSRPAAPAPASFPLHPLPPPFLSAAEAAGAEPERTEPRPQRAAGAGEEAAGRAAGGRSVGRRRR